jgi:succinyl-diaminopimelate desuccinylase
VTPVDDGAQQVLKDALAPMGFACRDLPFNDIQNLYARLGTGGPHFCFCGHTDVVPPGDEALWKFGPFTAAIHDG